MFHENSIYGKLYKNNMDGLNSFFTREDSLEKLVNEKSLALIADSPIHNFENYHCQIMSVWISPSQFSTKSMFAKKNYELTPFLANEIVKMAERGITSIIRQRNVISEPNCKERAKGRPLGTLSTST